MSNRPKVLHCITNSCDHPYLNRLVGNMDLQEYEVFVGSLESRGALQEHFEAVGVKTLSLDTQKRISYPLAILKLARWLRKNKIDIIQTHLFDASLVGLLAAFLARTKVRILTGHHSHEVQFYRGKPTFWLDVAAARYLSTHIIAPSENMRDLFVDVEGVSRGKITVIGHGFDPAVESKITEPSDISELWPNGGIRFIAIGKIFWIKGYEGLLRAIRDARNSEPNISLLIVGSGGVDELKQLVIELEIEEAVTFAGWRPDVASLLSSADIFVHNALAESFGMVVIEAMLAGMPVICTNVGIAAEVIENGKNGHMVSVGSVTELAHAMITMSRSKNDWNKIGEYNRKIAGEFTSRKMASEHQTAYSRWYSEVTG